MGDVSMALELLWTANVLAMLPRQLSVFTTDLGGARILDVGVPIGRRDVVIWDREVVHFCPNLKT